MQTSEVDILKKEIALLRKLLAEKDNGTRITTGQKNLAVWEAFFAGRLRKTLW